MAQRKNKFLLAAAAIAVVIPAGASAAYFLGYAVKWVKVEVPQTEVFVSIGNVSGSNNPDDFEIGHFDDAVTFNNVLASYHCGYRAASHGFGSLSDKKTFAYPQNAEVWLGEGSGWGGDKYAPTRYHSIHYPDFIPQTYEQKNGVLKKSSRMISRGIRFDFEVPVSKLAAPDGPNTPPIDGETLFSDALDEYVENGGNPIEFLRNDQTVSVDVPITLAGSCSLRSLDDAGSKESSFPNWPYPRYDYGETMVRITYQYRGDQSLTYRPSVEPGGAGQLQTPLQITDAQVSVDPPSSSGFCPRVVTATARLDFNQSPANERVVTYRFLENGQPATAWKKAIVQGTNYLELDHEMTVKATISPILISGFQVKAPSASLISSKKTLGLAQRPIVAIEAKVEGQTKIATRKYRATCTGHGRRDLEPSYGADLVKTPGFSIGGAAGPWGGHLTLDTSGAQDVTPRGCRFRFVYGVENIGDASTDEGFMNRMVVPGFAVGSATMPELPAGETRQASGSVLLPAGQYALTTILDGNHEIKEQSEANNTGFVTVSVPQACGGEPPAL